MKKVSVYLIRAGKTDNYKIGVSHDINSRMAGLQTANYEKLFLVFSSKFDTRFLALAVEESLHNEYSQFNTIGEWFRLSNNQIEAVIKTLSSELSEVILLKAKIKELELVIAEQRVALPLAKDEKKVATKRAFNSRAELLKALYRDGSVTEGNKLAPKSKVINTNNRKEDETIRSVYTHLQEIGAVEYRPSKGYYAKVDYNTAMSAFKN